MDKAEIANILYTDILIEAPRDIVNIIVSYLTFLPRHCLLKIKSTDQHCCGIMMCKNGQILVLMSDAFLLYQNTATDWKAPNFKIIAKHPLYDISSVSQHFSNKCFIAGQESKGKRALFYLDTTTNLKKSESPWFRYPSINAVKWPVSDNEILINNVYEYIMMHAWTGDIIVYTFEDNQLVKKTILKVDGFHCQFTELDKNKQLWCITDISNTLMVFQDLKILYQIPLKFIPQLIGKNNNNELIFIGVPKPDKPRACAKFDPIARTFDNVNNCRKVITDKFIAHVSHLDITIQPLSQNMNFGIMHGCEFINLTTLESYELSKSTTAYSDYNDDFLMLSEPLIRTYSFFGPINS